MQTCNLCHLCNALYASTGHQSLSSKWRESMQLQSHGTRYIEMLYSDIIIRYLRQNNTQQIRFLPRNFYECYMRRHNHQRPIYDTRIFTSNIENHRASKRKRKKQKFGIESHVLPIGFRVSTLTRIYFCTCVRGRTNTSFDQIDADTGAIWTLRNLWPNECSKKLSFSPFSQLLDISHKHFQRVQYRTGSCVKRSRD